jgi:hypothetical protein
VGLGIGTTPVEKEADFDGQIADEGECLLGVDRDFPYRSTLSAISDDVKHRLPVVVTGHVQ